LKDSIDYYSAALDYLELLFESELIEREEEAVELINTIDVIINPLYSI